MDPLSTQSLVARPRCGVVLDIQLHVADGAG
jgi:hypothetical protein